MEKAGFLLELWWWIWSRPFKRAFCSHDLVTHFTAEVFTVKGYERCSGVADCTKCGGGYFVHVPADDLEESQYWAESKSQLSTSQTFPLTEKP